ncbi:MAG: sugar nucleotide-binding protein, partial [Planctomycetes bacterium]|nr:sugar nucleotide-binding protein [Planctomycetota bacterium]
GGSGFLGAVVLRRAAAAGWERAVSLSRATGLDLAAADARSIESALRSHGASAVLLCAALAKIDECEREPERAAATNVRAPREVARACAALGLRLVHVSTDLAFGAAPAPSGGFREEHEPSPISNYGRTKVAGERAVLAAHPAALVARIPLLYGDSLGRGLGATDALLAALARGETPTLFSDEWRTPLDVVDAADALLELARGACCGLLHVAGPERLSRAELGLLAIAAAAARTLPRTAPRSSAPQNNLRPADVCLDSTLARSILRTRLRPAREALAR